MPKITTPPVQAKGITAAQIEEYADLLANIEDGKFVEGDEHYESRSKANAAASRIIRVLESRYEGLSLRSRTWEPQPDQWVFGLRPKDEQTEKPENAPELKPKTRSGRK